MKPVLAFEKCRQSRQRPRANPRFPSKLIPDRRRRRPGSGSSTSEPTHEALQYSAGVLRERRAQRSALENDPSMTESLSAAIRAQTQLTLQQLTG